MMSSRSDDDRDDARSGSNCHLLKCERLLDAGRAEGRALEFEQHPLAREAVAIVVQRAVARERAMTRDQNRYGIRANGSSRRARSIRTADSSRDVAIRTCSAGRNRAQLVPYRALKRSADDVQR